MGCYAFLVVSTLFRRAASIRSAGHTLHCCHENNDDGLERADCVMLLVPMLYYFHPCARCLRHRTRRHSSTGLMGVCVCMVGPFGMVGDPLVAQELVMIATQRPALIVLGGFPGSGKTTMTRRLARDWRLPRLASDTIGRTISASEALRGSDINAYWIAYEVLFALCDEFLRSGLSAVLDLNLGWAFQWRQLDTITDRNPGVMLMPIILE